LPVTAMATEKAAIHMKMPDISQRQMLILIIDGMAM
jgi:hypothetical protein